MNTAKKNNDEYVFYKCNGNGNSFIILVNPPKYLPSSKIQSICKNTDNLRINLKNKDQIYEIKDISICTKEESKNKIRDYNITKLEIIDKVFNFIDNYNNDLLIKS